MVPVTQEVKAARRQAKYAADFGPSYYLGKTTSGDVYMCVPELKGSPLLEDAGRLLLRMTAGLFGDEGYLGMSDATDIDTVFSSGAWNQASRARNIRTFRAMHLDDVGLALTRPGATTG